MECTSCVLSVTRQNVVFGVGNGANPAVVFVGEAPGAQEDATGEPFVGRAGKHLDSWIDKLGLARSDVYILNPVMCRPPENRNPTQEELTSCSQFFEGQLQILKPAIVVGMGRIATRALMGSEEPLKDLRGYWYKMPYGEVRITYHPSYILRNRRAQRLVDEDLVAVRERIGGRDSPG